MANFFRRHLLIVLALTDNLLVTSSDVVDLCYVYKNCKGKLSSSRDSSSQDRALHNTFLNKLRQDSHNHTSETNVSSLLPKTLTSLGDQITPTHGKTFDVGNGQNNEEKKSISPQRFPLSRTFRPISQNNEQDYDRRLISHSKPKDYRPKTDGGLTFRDDTKVKVKKELVDMIPLISPKQRSQKLPVVDCRLNQCSQDRLNAVSRQNRPDRFVTVADADRSRFRTLQEAREYLLKENGMNSRKNLKTFRFGKKRNSATTVGIDHWIRKPENQSYDRKPSMEFDLLQSADRMKQADGQRPFNLNIFLDQDPQLAQYFSRLPKNRPRFRYGKRMHKVLRQDRPRRQMSRLSPMTLKSFKALYMT